MTLEEIYPPPRSEDFKTVRTLCGTTNLCKKVIAAFILFVALPILVFFTFAIVPIRCSRRPALALTTSSSKTTGVIRVLLVGQFSLMVFFIYVSCIMLMTNARHNFLNRWLGARLTLQENGTGCEDRSTFTSILHDRGSQWEAGSEDVCFEVPNRQNTESRKARCSDSLLWQWSQ